MSGAQRQLREVRIMKKIGATVISIMFLAVCLGISIPHQKAEAATEPTGLFTQLSVSLNGGDGNVWATVKNDFTLFPATVTVYLELYYSLEYAESYSEMTYVGQAYLHDLDMGSALQYSASTEGQQRYWLARVRYKIDSRDWEEKTTNPVLFNAFGNHING